MHRENVLRIRQARSVVVCAVVAAFLFLPATVQAHEWASVTSYGATGDGTTDDTSDIQDALDANLTVFFPEPSKFYKVSSLQLKTGHTLIGPGRWDREVDDGMGGTVVHAVVEGTGTGPLLKTSNLPTTDVRRVTIRDLSLKNKDHPAIQLRDAPDFLIQNCFVATVNAAPFDANDAPAIEGLRSYRGTIRDSTVGQAGASWAISFLDNMNAVSIVDNTITGGTAGNGIDIGKSQSVYITGNDMEVCNGYGIRIAGNDDTLSGVCEAIVIEGNYLEQVVKPFSLGEHFVVRSAKVCANRISNATTSAIPDDPEYGFAIARVEDVEISGNVLHGYATTLKPFLTIERIAAGGVTEIPVSCRIVDNWIDDVSDNFTITGTGLNDAHRSRIMSGNVMQFDAEPATGVTHIYTSPVITSTNSSTLRAWVQSTTYGGNVDRIEIIDAAGTVDGTLQIGRAGDLDEIVSKDLSTLTFANGAVDVTPTATLLRPGLDTLLRVTSMNSGSFRVRIHYRN